MHQFYADAVGVGDEVLFAFAASGFDAVGIDVEAAVTEFANGGFDVVDPEAEVFEAGGVLGQVDGVAAVGEQFDEVVTAGFDIDHPEAAVIVVHSECFGQAEDAGVEIE